MKDWCACDEAAGFICLAHLTTAKVIDMMKKDSRDIALAALDSHISHVAHVIELNGRLTAEQHRLLQASHKRLGKLLEETT